MYTILLLTAILVVAIACFMATRDSYEYKFVPMMAGLAAIISGLSLGFLLLSIPVARYDAYAQLHALEELRTMDNADFKISEYELVAWRKDVVVANMNLAKMKYYARNPWTSVWYPEAVIYAEPIR